MTLLRSIIFFLLFATVSTVLSLASLPALLLDRRVIVGVSRTWSRATLWGLRVIAGLDYEIRGTLPPKGVLVASKHMSMWDTVALYLLIDDPTVVVKRELLRVPFYGWYVWKAGVIAIDRDARSQALRRMIEGARAAIAGGHAILIFPEGHRMAPGAAPEYKPGVAALYSQLDVACVPVALNSGLFWTGPMGFLKKRGRVVIQFLEPIPPGLRARDFLQTLETRIETATAGLLAEGRALLERNETGAPAIAGAGRSGHNG
jgi:1-acyl-sn-glycerol-3-phosphate acyltransferase